MTRKRNHDQSDDSDHPASESDLRGLIAQSEGGEYIAHASLAEAKADPEGIVVFQGDDGGQIYAVARAAFVSCPEAQLHRLLSELDAVSWRDLEAARVFFESLPVGAGVGGGMGGGVVAPELWVHPELQQYEAAIRNVLLGRQVSILA